ncbi:hypothetical protein BTVI_140495 [Pitangus sulphuratus]|nr:hypothetical protein BTVI_140495 [Pitangus sulphuratus]
MNWSLSLGPQDKINSGLLKKIPKTLLRSDTKLKLERGEHYCSQDGSHQPKKSMLGPGLKPDGQRSQKLEDNDDTDLLVTFSKQQVDNIRRVLKDIMVQPPTLAYPGVLTEEAHALRSSAGIVKAVSYGSGGADVNQQPVSPEIRNRSKHQLYTDSLSRAHLT